MTHKQMDFDYLFKIVMIGDSGVGKTNLLGRFVENNFQTDSKPTIGVQFSTKTVVVDGHNIKSQIWDTAGQERFRAITHAYYKGAVGALIAFDVSRSQTFEHVSIWLQQLSVYGQEDTVIMLIGNKVDLPNREVTRETASQFAASKNILYLETSAASGENVDEAFSCLIKEIYDRVQSYEQKKEDISPMSTSTASNERTNSNSSNPAEGKTNIHSQSMSKKAASSNLKLTEISAKKKKDKKSCC